MVFRFCHLPMMLLLLAVASVPMKAGQEPGSFRLDPKTGKIKEGKRDYAHTDATEVLKVVIIDWMTNPKVKDEPYSYLIDPDDETSEVPKLKLKRLLIDERYVPKGFDLMIPGIKVELFDRSKQDLKKGEMCIRIDRFEPRKDRSIEIEFVHAGYGIIGGDWVTYKAKNVKGRWVAEFSRSIDP